MSVFSLPSYLTPDDTFPIQLFDYHTFSSNERNKINLTKNVFSFLQEGTKEIITENEPNTIDRDQFLLIKSGNCLMTETISPAKRTYRSMLLFFTDEALLEALTKNNMSISSSAPSHAFYTCGYDSYIRLFIESLERINALEKRVQTSLLQIKFEEILIYLVQKEGKPLLDCLLNRRDNQTIRFIHVVENNKLRKLTVQELAFLSNMSVSTFKRMFYKHFEDSPIKWFQEKRLEYAANQLKTQQKRPIELFEDAGYESLSNFIQAFKSRYGITPKQFQLQH